MARILLVEPDQILTRIYTQAFEQGGHKVRTAASAQAAVDTADKSTPDVVVLELQLPEHNGVEFLYEFRSYPEWLTVPIIINTHVAPSSILLEQTAWEPLGVTAYLYKSGSTLQALLAAIKQATAD